MNIYEQLPHNPQYKLVEVEIDNKTLVYGETNEGKNQGLEVYYYKANAEHFYTSKRYEANKVPQIYNELYLKLQKVSKKCKAGHKITLSIQEYK